MTKKQQALVICPGRGSYNKEQLGYFFNYHQDNTALINTIDNYRTQHGFETIASLDQAEKFNLKIHTLGENASPLIYGCAEADFEAINLEKYDICAITGNSMGWYIALAAAQALKPPAAIEVINTMGAMMKDGLIGAQTIYPIIDKQWQVQGTVKQQLLELITSINQQSDCELYLSIDLGAYLVVAGDTAGLKQFESKVPPIDQYPMRLYNHGAFHTPMLKPLVAQAKQQLSQSLFNAPNIPLIDGRGHIWQPYSTDVEGLYQYTLDHQVCEPYYFNQAIDIAIKEYAPDVFIVLGPGNSLSSNIAQRLIALNWQGISNKEDFIARQNSQPIIIAMGLEEQRELAL